MPAHPARKQAAVERIELLSSPFLVDLNGTKQVRISDDKERIESDDEEEIKPNSASSPARYSSSPLRIRDKFAGLFGIGHLKVQNEAGFKENCNDSGEKTPQENLEVDEASDTSQHIENQLLKDTFDGASNNELTLDGVPEADLEDEAILKLREVVLQETNEERDDTVNDCSSEYAEETYFNTIRNQDIAAIPDEVSPIPRGRKLLDLPVSRLFLTLFPEQEDLFKREKDWVSGNYNYSLLTIWVRWAEIDDRDSSQHLLRGNKKRLCALGKIPDKLHLYELISEYKQNFQSSPLQPFETNLFREGIKPKRSSPELINGGTLELQLKFSKKESYKLWKDVIRFVLDDCYVKFVNYEVYELRQRIVGLGFKLDSRIRNDGSKVGGITMKFWIIPLEDERRLSKGLIVEMAHLLSEGLPDHISDHIGNFEFTENRMTRRYRVFAEDMNTTEDALS